MLVLRRMNIRGSRSYMGLFRRRELMGGRRRYCLAGVLMAGCLLIQYISYFPTVVVTIPAPDPDERIDFSVYDGELRVERYTYFGIGSFPKWELYWFSDRESWDNFHDETLGPLSTQVSMYHWPLYFNGLLLVPLFWVACIASCVFINWFWKTKCTYRCYKCGYDIRWSTENRCPECGKPLEPGQFTQVDNRVRET